MIELTELFQRALDQAAGEPLRVVDPRTNETYVLLRSEVFETVKDLLPSDDDFEGIDVGALIERAMREDDENDPLLESYQKYKDLP